MGATESLPSSAQNKTSTSGVFSESEERQIEAIFAKITGSTTKSVRVMTNEQILTYCGRVVSDDLARRLHLMMKEVLPPGGKMAANEVHYGSLRLMLARLLKGTIDERSEAVCFLAAGRKTDSVERDQMAALCSNLLSSYKLILQRGEAWSSWKHLSSSDEDQARLVDDIVQALDDLSAAATAPDQCPESRRPYTVDTVQTWLQRSALIDHLLSAVFSSVFPVGEVSIKLPVPFCRPADQQPSSSLLDLFSMALINHHLVAPLAAQWRPLYCSQMHGESFASMVRRVSNRGPSVLVVRDTDGYVFGGFASVEWMAAPQFRGCSRSFLFTVRPKLHVYLATGQNTNFLYLNSGQETLPNGLGLGGQLDYFGLWLDAEFGRGHSRAKPQCSTYDSPQLSRCPEFRIDRVEIWGVGPEPDSDRHDSEEEVTSILDNDLEAKAMLTLLNRGPVSEGLRESDSTADTPDITHLR